MRLLCVEKVDFRKSEETNFNEVMKRRKLTLKTNDVVCLLSSNEKQLYFVYGFTDMDVYSGRTGDYTGEVAPTLRSEKYRICGHGGWNPLMLANYAATVGIILSGVRRFESYYKELVE